MLCGDSVRQFSNMLPSFLNLNALPVPMLRQVYSDPLDRTHSAAICSLSLKSLKIDFLDRTHSAAICSLSLKHRAPSRAIAQLDSQNFMGSPKALFGSILVTFGCLLGPLWDPLGTLWVSIGSLWVPFGPLCGHFGGPWPPLGTILVTLAPFGHQNINISS